MGVPRRVFGTLLLVSTLLLCAPDASSSPTTQPLASRIAITGACTITGRVTSESEVPLSQMVVFLERDGGASNVPEVVPPPAVVRQKGAKFSPPLVIISMNQQVNFLNDEEKNIEHNVFSNAPAKKFDLGLYPPNQGKLVTFDKPGAVLLYCSIHKFMDGVVYVCPTPYHSRVAEDGTYRIENVPPGRYKLRTWQRQKRFPEKNEPLDVAAGATRTVNLELRRP
jgi:plastocyanin